MSGESVARASMTPRWRPMPGDGSQAEGPGALRTDDFGAVGVHTLAMNCASTRSALLCGDSCRLDVLGAGSLRPNGTSTICHCRLDDRPQAQERRQKEEDGRLTTRVDAPRRFTWRRSPAQASQRGRKCVGEAVELR